MRELRPARRFREALAAPGIIPSLGVHDVFTALIVEQCGFHAVFLGGFGISASLLGLPDLSFLDASQMADTVRRVAARVAIPVIADGDTGHGDLHNVRHTVELFEAAGAAGILLEDQVFPKRCGHFKEKQVISSPEMVSKIETAVRSRRDPDFVIIARTDSRQVHGLDDAIERVLRCCEAGADMAFVEAPESRAELEEIARRVPHPLFANMLSDGVTPVLSVQELEEIGYKVAVCPVESLLVTARAVRDMCRAFRSEGRLDHHVRDLLTFQELKDLLGVDRFLASGEES